VLNVRLGVISEEDTVSYQYVTNAAKNSNVSLF